MNNMPFTPLIGLSVILHLFIILISKIRGHKKLRGFHFKKLKKPKVIRRYSLTIIGTVFFVIIFNTILIMFTVVTEKHSTIRNLVEYTTLDLNKIYNNNINP